MNLTLDLKLLDPRWIDEPNLGRWGMGVDFRCPAGHRNSTSDFCHRYYCYFDNPLDGGPRSVQHQVLFKSKQVYWHRLGEDFATLTLDMAVNHRGAPLDRCTVNVFGCGGRLLLQDGHFSVFEPWKPKARVFVPEREVIVAQPSSAHVLRPDGVPPPVIEPTTETLTGG